MTDAERIEWNKLQQHPTVLVAREFSQLLLHYLGSAAMTEVIRRNRTRAYGDVCCASHDFCDANMIMAEAFSNCDLKTNIDCAGWEGYSEHGLANAEVEAATDLWNRAWTLAKAAEFAADKIQGGKL